MLSQELHIVFHVEPFHGVTFETNPVGEMNLDLAEIPGLGHYDVRYLVVEDSQVHCLYELVIALGSSLRELDGFKSLVIFKQAGLGANDYLALTCFAYHQDCIAGPYADGDCALVFRVYGDSP